MGGGPWAPLPYVCCRLGGEPVCALLDSGSSLSLLNIQWFLEYRHIAKLFPEVKPIQRCRLASGQLLPLQGYVKGSLSVGNFSWPVEFGLVKDLPVSVLLGCDFINKTGLVLDLSGYTFGFRFAPGQVFGLCECARGIASTVLTCSAGSFDVAHLTAEQASRLMGKLDQYSDLFSDRLGVTNVLQYQIRLSDDTPVAQSPYRLSPPKMKILRSKLDKMLQQGVIRPSTSSYASPIFLVPKDQGKDFRPVVDYRRLNKKVILESVPLPDLHNSFTWFAGARWFTVLDLNQAYYQIPLTEDCKHVTAFCTDWNLFEFNRVPFGLATGAAVLSRLLDYVLGDLKLSCVFNYLDDLVIYSSTFEEHLDHLSLVFHKLREAGLTVKPSKITLARNQVSFLGHLVSGESIRIDQQRTKALRNLPPPKDKKGIARFIGMANYFRRFVPNFAQLAAPLNELRRKGARFIWGEAQEAAFHAIKSAIANPPVLGVPDFNRRFVVQTDASNSGVSAVLLQEVEGQRQPLAYASRRLTDAEIKYSVYECEALAVLFALEKFRFYLEHREFDLETDNQALSWVLARPRKTGRIARWAVRISAFKFNVRHIKGSDNALADILSRMFEESSDSRQGSDNASQILSLPVLGEVPQLFSDLRMKQQEDPIWGPIRKELSEGKHLPQYTLSKGILCKRTGRKGDLKICVPAGLIDPVFRYYHDSLVGGHLGVHKTLQRIKQSLVWPSMDRDVKRLVNSCQLCRQAKPSSSPHLGFLNSEREAQPMDKVFIDYLGPLPRTKRGNQYILVVIDGFSRFTWLVPSRNVTASTTIAHLTNIFSLFGPPKRLVSDNAPAFRSAPFRSFCFGNAIQHIFTTPYYPQGSFAERVNRNLKSALIIYHQKNPNRWDASLPWLNLAFNSASHEALRATPASLMFSYPINSPLSNLWQIQDLLPSVITPDHLKENWKRARANIHLAHRRQALRYNRGRRPFTGKPGDQVYIRNYPGRGQQVGKVSKFTPRFLGPCTIVRILSPGNLLVKEEATGKVYRVHLNQVKFSSSSNP